MPGKALRLPGGLSPHPQTMDAAKKALKCIDGSDMTVGEERDCVGMTMEKVWKGG